MKNLKTQYESIVSDYVDVFCKKQHIENNGWVANNIGEILECSGMFLNFDDIRNDIDNNIEPQKIIYWYRYVESYLFAAHLKEIKTYAINYKSFLIGARYEVKLCEL